LDLHMFQGILETHTSSFTDLTNAVEEIPASIDQLNRNVEKLNQELVQMNRRLEDVEAIKTTLQELGKKNKIW